MPTIVMSLRIEAPIALCFDLARSIDIHMESTSRTRERAVDGRTSGLIELGEEVTWEAVHFGIRQRLTAKITAMERPYRFVDEMVSGAFQRFYHEHAFEERANSTWMTDTFDYTSPCGWVGRCADVLFLEAYMRRFFRTRNLYIKQLAERQAESYERGRAGS